MRAAIYSEKLAVLAGVVAVLTSRSTRALSKNVTV
jgi:hypothetical protein